MFERDYLMRQLTEFMAAMRRSMERASGEADAIGAARGLESAVGSATDIDGETLLSLSPDSIATIMQVSGADPKVAGFMARSLLLASRYYAEGGDESSAALRSAQAHAVAEAFGHELSDEDVTPEALERFFIESGVEETPMS